MKVKEWGVFALGVISLGCVNAIAFVYDGGWIDTAIALDSAFIGALIAQYLGNKGSVSKD